MIFRHGEEEKQGRIVIEWVGSIALALCALPQAVKCYREKSSAGLSVLLAVMWRYKCDTEGSSER